MNKKILMGLGAALAVVASVAAMSAYEAHVINVTAHIENALTVHPKEIAFGTVFPQEYVEEQFTVTFSQSFEGEGRVDDVEYVIKQKPKPLDDDSDPAVWAKPESCQQELADVVAAREYCHDNPSDLTCCYRDLCQYLSKLSTDENDTSHPSYYVEDASGDYCVTPTRYYNELSFSSGGWAGWSCPLGSRAVGGGYEAGATVALSGIYKEGVTIGTWTWPAFADYTYSDGEEGFILQNDNDNETIEYYVDCLASAYADDATGRLSKIDEDRSDIWIVDLKVPPFKGFVAQDWPAGCPVIEGDEDGEDFGCDLWIEVTNISETPPPECSDGIDNDGNGHIDYPADTGCESAADNDESGGQQQPA